MLEKQEFLLTDTAFEKRVTRYLNPEILERRGRIFYFHGGGLLYGSRTDLPTGHLEHFTRAGFEILAFDYPLAPAADLETILMDVCRSVNTACEPENGFTDHTLPYFLFGRSAGAYLCLLAAASGALKKQPLGLLSYYGYGFLCDGWFETPDNWYGKLPAVSAACLEAIPKTLHTEGDLNSHYSVYVYARQTGKWKELIYQGREKFFYLNYSLRACEKLPCPVFAAHSTGDTDVPYGEFLALCERYPVQKFIASGSTHDFDRDPENPFTAQLLAATLEFINQRMEHR